MVCFLQKKEGYSHMIFLLLQQHNFSDVYTAVVKPAYDLSLGYSSTQSYKLFKFLNKHGWIKITITLPVYYQKIWLHQWARVQHHQGHKISSRELTTQMQCSAWAYTLISIEPTTPVQFSLRVRVKEQTFQIVSKRIVDLATTAKSATNMLLKFPQKCETV